MKKVLWALGLFFFVFLTSCKKTETTVTTPTQVIPPSNITPVVTGPIVYPVNTLDSFSSINKTTSWYTTTRAMTSLFDVNASKYWGFELISGGSLIPYNTSTTNTFNASKSYYWNDLGTYLYTDFTGDGKVESWF